jgi:hypothetical protein
MHSVHGALLIEARLAVLTIWSAIATAVDFHLENAHDLSQLLQSVSAENGAVDATLQLEETRIFALVARFERARFENTSDRRPSPSRLELQGPTAWSTANGGRGTELTPVIRCGRD